MVWPGRNFYRLPHEVQRRRTVNGFLAYLKRTVYPYHPYLRRLYDEKGIDVGGLKSYDDVRSLPLLTRDDLRSDPLSRDVMRIVLAPRSGVDPDELKQRVTRAVKAETEVTPDVLELADDVNLVEAELFRRTGIKADYLVDKRRPPAWSMED